MEWRVPGKGVECEAWHASSAATCTTLILQPHARSKCEVALEGEGPWRLPDGGDDLEIVFTPGHTAGHCVLMYQAQRVRAPGPLPAPVRLCAPACGSVCSPRRIVTWCLVLQLASCTLCRLNVKGLL